ncbi:MAG: SAP domain-containing protein [bacterium]|nr:SAP domain-containing protein [bacterium]
MSNKEPKNQYRVLQPIGFSGRQEIGAVVNLTDAEAKSIGEDFVEFIIEKPEAPEGDETIDHVVTQEDLDNNPSLEEEGVQVGDVIQLPKPEPLEDKSAKELKEIAKSLGLAASGSKEDLIARIQEANK